MTPEEQVRVNRLTRALEAHIRGGITNIAYGLCCELEAITVAALLVRMQWGAALVDKDLTPDSRMKMLHTVMAASRAGAIASTAMSCLEPLYQGEAAKELEGALGWLTRPEGPLKEGAIEAFCADVVAQSPPDVSQVARQWLERMYDNNTNPSDEETDD